ncbi:MAG: hypothetical protein JKY95_07930 [Planctomycetaceae bacterium]|nr:hypothetical protein [Planctomycetaceae bacterium]
MELSLVSKEVLSIDLQSVCFKALFYDSQQAKQKAGRDQPGYRAVAAFALLPMDSD